MDRRVAVITAWRTPMSKIPGRLSSVSDVHMLSAVFQQAARGARNVSIDKAIAGCSFPVEKDNLCRKAALAAGLPAAVHAATVSKTCASSDEAFFIGCQAIMSGCAQTVLVGGVEKNSNSPHILGVMKQKVKDAVRGRLPRYAAVADSIEENDMAYIAERLARKWCLTKERLDSYTIRSRQKALQARRSGVPEEECLPLSYTLGEESGWMRDDELPDDACTEEEIRRGTPLFLEDGLHTQYSAAPIADGAAAVLLMDYQTAVRAQIKPLALVADFASAGVSSDRLGEAMAVCAKKLLQRNRLEAAKVDLYEINESFAAQALTTLLSLGLEEDRVNVNGGNLAYGYPVGATGLRMYTTLLAELHRREARYGLSVICAGGYMAQAVLFQSADMA